MDTEMAQRHRTQRQVISLIGAGGVAGILILGVLMWQWVKPGAAQQSATPVPPSQAASVEQDMSGRIEELSRSQDRLVEAVIGIITVTGAGFFILVGYSAIQANRNAERESAFIRDSAEIQIKTAVSQAEGRVQGVVSQAEEQLVAQVQEIETRALESINRTRETSMRGIERLAREREDQFLEKADRARDLFRDYLDGFSEYFKWTASREIRALRSVMESGDAGEIRSLAVSILRLAVVARGISKLVNDGGTSRLDETTLILTHEGAKGMMAEFTVPEENIFWYENHSANYHAVKQILDGLSKFADYQHMIKEIRSFIPQSERRPDDEALQRMINSHKANNPS